MKEALKSDRARIQVGRISHFGLMEMSRQRIRSSVLESSTETCPQCGGTGHVRAVASVALQLVRGVEETLLKGATHNLIVRSRSDVAIYVLNHKRAHLRMLEERFKISIAVNVDATLSGHPAFAIDRGEQVMSLDQAKAIASTIRPDTISAYNEGDEVEVPEAVEDDVLDELEVEGEEASAEAGDEARGRKRRRRGRRGRGRDSEPREINGVPQDEATAQAEGDEPAEIGDAESLEETEAESEDAAAANGDGERRRRRRGRRGGRRNRRERPEGEEAVVEGAQGDAQHGDGHEEGVESDGSHHDDNVETIAVEAPAPAAPAPRAEPAAQPVQMKAPEPVEEAPVRRRSTIREAPPAYSSAEPVAAAPAPAAFVTPAPEPAPEPAQAEAAEKPRRKGWWSLRG